MTHLIVGGTFDEQGGKPSKIIATLAASTRWPVLNGGTLKQLSEVDFASLKVLLWAPNISNEEEKILPSIKVRNPRLLLISTKRVVEKLYSDFDIVSRLLKSKSNLGIKIENSNGVYQFSLRDPLGNTFCQTSSVYDLGIVLRSRVQQLLHMTRIGSHSLGPCIACPTVENEFVEIVRDLGDEFSRYVNAVHPERFLGNASARATDRITRCCHGFPAARVDAADAAAPYLVSRRNVDKATMSTADFVPVTANEDRVEYFGDIKPSVDAPIQVRLFNHYRNVRYIVHGHVYVADTFYTRSKIPCGHVEEFNEIKDLFPDAGAANFAVNLWGHGCLILAHDLEFLRRPQLMARPFPED